MFLGDKMTEIQQKILEQIKVNNLNNIDYDFLVQQICVLNNKPYAEIKVVIDDLIRHNKIVVSDKQSNTSYKNDGNIIIKNSFTKKTNNENILTPVDAEISSNISNNNDERQHNIEYAYELLDKKDKKNKNTKIIGKIQGTSKDYAFLIPDDITQKDIFIPAKSLNGAMHNDIVAVVTSISKGRPEGKVIQIIKRGNERIVGVVNITKRCAFVTPDDVKFGIDIYVPLNKINNANNGDKVVVSIIKYNNNKTPEGLITEVLGKPNEINTEVLAILRSYGYFDSFPNKVLESAKTIQESIDKSKYGDRVDLTNEIIFTIDGEDTRDIDDAISLKVNEKGNRVLGVHIADVGEYVREGNIIDEEAFNRATSVYFPNLVLPMLPRELSNGICSLNERVDRLALSVLIEFDENAQIVNHKIFESIINSKKRFTYTQVYKVLTQDSEALKEFSQFSEILINMNKLSSQLIQARKSRGCIDFNIPEVMINLDELGNVTNLSKREHNDSHKLIESFMIVANEVVATHFLNLKTPFVYRIHEKPDEEKITNFISIARNFGLSPQIDTNNITPMSIQGVLNQAKGSDCEYAINKICLRSMKKAKYDPACIGHFGLASPKYCHFTSPIRRYPDLTIHRIIKHVLKGELKDKLYKETRNFVFLSSNQSSEKERNADSVERDVDDLYKAFYMKQFVGSDFDGIISGVSAFGTFVELDNTVEGLIRLEDLPYDTYEFDEAKLELQGKRNTYKIGQKVRVKVLSVKTTEREIDFMLV